MVVAELCLWFLWTDQWLTEMLNTSNHQKMSITTQQTALTAYKAAFVPNYITMVAMLAHDVIHMIFSGFSGVRAGVGQMEESYSAPQTDTNSGAPAVLRSLGCEVGIDGGGMAGKSLFSSKASKRSWM